MALRIALAQINLHVGAIERNAEHAIAEARRARDDLGAHLVVFPELTLVGYPPEDLLHRESLYQRVDQAANRIAAEVPDVGIVIGMPLRDGGARYNAAVMLYGGERIAQYRKQALPNYGVFDECRYFEPGTEPCVVELHGVRLGLTVCEDLWREEPVRGSAAAGAELVLNLNASPFHQGKRGERTEVVRARVADVGLPVVYVNLVGGQDELVFDGGSFAMRADGEVVATCGEFVEQTVLVEFDREQGLSGVGSAPQLDELAAVYAALVLAVRDYVSKNGFKGALLGLSGGIDSALTLAIAVDALGADQVQAVAMPSRYTSDLSNNEAERQARTMGVKFGVIPIEPAFAAFREMLAAEFKGLAEDTTEENIQARCRGIILMALSNKTGRMLLTTGNKSEMSVGYATLYGDMAGGFAPLKDVPKMLVYELSRWRNREGEVIPRVVIDRPPSAELRPDQQDSDSLPPYEILDEILRRYVELEQGRDEIVAAGFDVAVVERVIRLVDMSEYKRRQAPPGVKITPRAFGKDRRYPIVNGFAK